MTYVKTIDNITTHRFVPPIELEASNGNDYMRSTQLVYEQIYDSTEIINNDKICRQHGIMKNPYILPWGGVMLSSCYVSLRNGYHRAVRTIIYQGYMDPQKTYYVWLHSHLNDIYDYMISGDYIELVPECIYKNRHEDIW